MMRKVHGRHWRPVEVSRPTSAACRPILFIIIYCQNLLLNRLYKICANSRSVNFLDVYHDRLHFITRIEND